MVQCFLESTAWCSKRGRGRKWSLAESIEDAPHLSRLAGPLMAPSSGSTPPITQFAISSFSPNLDNRRLFRGQERYAGEGGDLLLCVIMNSNPLVPCLPCQVSSPQFQRGEDRRKETGHDPAAKQRRGGIPDTLCFGRLSAERAGFGSISLPHEFTVRIPFRLRVKTTTRSCSRYTYSRRMLPCLYDRWVVCFSMKVGFDPRRSQVDPDTLEAFIRAPLAGNLDQVSEGGTV